MSRSTSAHGEWLNFLDDDDELDPAHVATLMQAMRTRREKLVYSATRVVDKRGKQIARVGHPGNHVQLLFPQPLGVAGDDDPSQPRR